MIFEFHRSSAGAFTVMLLAVTFPLEIAAAGRAGAGATSVVVKYHDLDLETERGAVELYNRIHTAAVHVCTLSEPPFFLRTDPSEWHSCVDHTIASAVKAVHNKKLSAYHWTQIWKHHDS